MEVRAVDREVYEEEILPWLPPKIIDIHAHVALAEHLGPMTEERRRSNWAIEAGLAQSWEELRSNLSALFPWRDALRQAQDAPLREWPEVDVLAFGVPFRETDFETNNSYVLKGASDPRNRARALLLTRPEWEPSVIEEAMGRGFIGIKPYPDLAPASDGEPGIFDFLPHSHLDALNRLGGILMLHLPRKGRLADPDNIRELSEISRRCPNIRIIVAHIGRSFCLPTAQRGLPSFADEPGVFFDISAVMNADVLAYAIETVGPERLLYGSDLPITLIRGYREHVGETYINYTDGPFSWNTDRKPPEVEAKYTYYLYEELRALIAALKRLGLGTETMEKVMYLNAAGLLEGRESLWPAWP